MNYLIGSRALNYWFPDWKIKEDTDWDVVSWTEVKGEGIEWHDRYLLNNDEIADYATPQTIKHNNLTLHVVNPIGLSLIKRSHLHRDIGFDKHMNQWLLHLQQFQKYWSMQDYGFYSQRSILTKKDYPQRTPNLMQPKYSFFDDAVKKVYEHDYLHELVAFYDKPLYTQLLRDKTLAWCEQTEWNKLDHADKVRCVQEEVYVIATERFIIPKGFDFNTKIAYNKALNKVCTTLCSGWFRDFAIDNYLEIVNSYDKKKFETVINKLKGK